MKSTAERRVFLKNEGLKKYHLKILCKIHQGSRWLETLRFFKSVRSSTTIDWAIKESVQATLRRIIRRILRKYGYPPDKQEKAIQTVIEQAKLLAEELS